MASATANPTGSYRQVGKEKTFYLDEEDGLHVMNRVREYEFTPLKPSAVEPGNPVKIGKKGKDTKAVSGNSNAADPMRFGIVGHPVAAVTGALALAVLRTVVKRRRHSPKRDADKAIVDAKDETIPAGPIVSTPTPSVGEIPKVENQTHTAHAASQGEALSAVDTSASPARLNRPVEEPVEWPEPGTPRSIRTVSSTGGGSLRSFSVDGSQNQRLASHRKETVVKLRQQLQSRDEMILEVQQQLAAQEHFTRESRTIIMELEQQLKQAVEGGQKLGAENRELADQVERLGKDLGEATGESARLVDENKRLSQAATDLEAEGDRLEERVVELEREKRDWDRERDQLRDGRREALQKVELERGRFAGALRERTEALSEARAHLKSSADGVREEVTGPLVEEKERLVEELKIESEKRAALEREAEERVKEVERELERTQKMLKGKDRLLEGYEKERVHLTTVLQDLERQVETRNHQLEAFQQTAATVTEDVQSSNDSDGPRTVAGASPSRGEEVESNPPRGPRNMHLMKSFDNPLSDMSPDVSPTNGGRPMSVSKPARPYDGRLMDASVYPSPNGVLDNRPSRMSVDEHRSSLKPAADTNIAQLHSDVDALARELSDRFRTVTEKKKETGRLVADLQRHNDLIVDLQRKIVKEEELGLGEDDWLSGGVEKEDSGTKQIEGTAQAAILVKKLEQVALQRQMDERLAELQQEESEISRLKSRVAAIGGKANGAEKAEPAAPFDAHSDVLGAELAHKLALQEQQANEGIPEVQRLSATFQRGSPLFAKAQDELLRKSLSALDLKPGRVLAGQRSASDMHELRHLIPNNRPFARNGLAKWASDTHLGESAGWDNHATTAANGVDAEHESSDAEDAPQDELARLTVEVERELSQDFAKRMTENGNGNLVGSEGSEEMEVEEEEGEKSVGDEEHKERENVAEEAKGSTGDLELESTLAAMLESTLDDMVRMCTPASSQTNSPFPNKRF